MIRKYKKQVADFLEKPLKIILPLLLLAVFSIKIFYSDSSSTCNPLSVDEIIMLAPYVLLLNILGMYGGFLLSKVFSLDKASQLTVAIETGLQNTALALSVATMLENSCEIEKPALVYAMFTFFTAVLFLLVHSDVKVKDIFK